MKKYKKILIIIIAIILIIVFYYKNEINQPNNNDEGVKTFVIEKGQGIEEIAQKLKNENFLDSTFSFYLYVAINDLKSKFIDGEYSLRTDLTIRDLVQQIVNYKNTLDETKITLIEGWSVAQMDDYLFNKSLIIDDDLVKYSNGFENGYEFLQDKPKNTTLEGYLYPDTYIVYQDTNVGEITKKMLDNFDAKLTNEMREEISRQGKTIYEVLTLASIVELEMYGYENRRMVASVFNNRLRVGMALQSDATVNYITGKGTTRPSLDDIAIDNEYNTYQYIGLPPGPICNPSIESIRAVLYSAETNYFYFLTAENGEIYFAKTHDEHVSNKFKYLK